MPDGKLKVDLVKLSHHGSGGNTGPDLIEKIACKHYVVSTNGSIYRHPYPETMAWIIKRGGQEPVIHFNYKNEHNSIWANKGMQRRFAYHTIYPESEGTEIKLL